MKVSVVVMREGRLIEPWKLTAKEMMDAASQCDDLYDELENMLADEEEQ